MGEEDNPEQTEETESELYSDDEVCALVLRMCKLFYRAVTVCMSSFVSVSLCVCCVCAVVHVFLLERMETRDDGRQGGTGESTKVSPRTTCQR